jgi:hypothetical protein
MLRLEANSALSTEKLRLPEATVLEATVWAKTAVACLVLLSSQHRPDVARMATNLSRNLDKSTQLPISEFILMASDLGFRVQYICRNWNWLKLEDINMPILLLLKNGNTIVAMTDSGAEKEICVSDPLYNNGEIFILSREELERVWSGDAMTVDPRSSDAQLPDAASNREGQYGIPLKAAAKRKSIKISLFVLSVVLFAHILRITISDKLSDETREVLSPSRIYEYLLPARAAPAYLDDGITTRAVGTRVLPDTIRPELGVKIAAPVANATGQLASTDMRRNGGTQRPATEAISASSAVSAYAGPPAASIPAVAQLAPPLHEVEQTPNEGPADRALTPSARENSMSLLTATIPAVSMPSAVPDHQSRGPATAISLGVGSGTGAAAVSLEHQFSGVRLSEEEVSALRGRGDALFRTGDVVSARLFYERAAEGGDGLAALQLGETYDPAFLSRAGINGIRGDGVTATRWYLRASELGAGEAQILLKSATGR